jgi:hypothetical protein
VACITGRHVEIDETLSAYKVRKEMESMFAAV